MLGNQVFSVVRWRTLVSFLIISFGLFPPTIEAKIFDGQKKGFCIGMGLGYSPYASWSQSEFDLSDTNDGFAMRRVIGYGITQRETVTLEVNSVYSTSPTVLNNSCIAYRFWGLNWVHHFTSEKHALFSVMGVGGMDFYTKYRNVRNTGVTAHLGGGWYTFEHVSTSVHLYLSKDRTEGSDYTHAELSLLVTFISY